VRPTRTTPVAFTPLNMRSAAPDDVGGRLRVATLNLANYFNTIDEPGNTCGPQADGCRGADSVAERTRQLAKITQALWQIDADIVGLVELENDGTDAAIASIAAGLAGYAHIATGFIGTDAIKVGIIYRTSTVAPLGSFAILDSSVDANFFDSKNRPALVQTFEELSGGERLTIAVNHFKSKGSPCDDVGDAGATDGQGNCNGTRTLAAGALANFLASDPTGSGDPDFLILGDLNAYAMEDPIKVLEAAGYDNLLGRIPGADAYTFLFDGQLGYLDYALATSSLTAQVTGTAVWHINADEASLFDYNDAVQDPSEASFSVKPSVNALYSADPYRASDHDPIIVGLDLASPEVQRCDVDSNGQVDISDVRAISALRNQPAAGPDDPADADGDGIITVIDARLCVLQCTNAQCAP
ncbi:MAG: ExeM/NucH family extracellular endonuclease, partial [Rhodobacteraceae bacterium]